MEDDIISKIDKAYDDMPKEKTRQYIGASGVGHPCDAYISLCHRGFPETPPQARIKRIFRDGHRIEEDVVADLKKAGYEVDEVDPETKKQFYYSMFGNHVSGSGDGNITIDGELHLLEIKSMNATRHNRCKKVGVKVSDYKYYAQVQLMMGLSDIKKSCFVSYNKNTSEYLSEIITFDEFEYSELLRRINVVLNNEGKRIAKDKTDWRCKSCFKREACWEGLKPSPACHNCKHAIAADTGGKAWWCNNHNKEAVNTCDDYTLFLPKPFGTS